jgi:transposase
MWPECTTPGSRRWSRLAAPTPTCGRVLPLVVWRPEPRGNGWVVGNKRRRFDPQLRAGAVRIVAGTGKPVARVVRDLGISAYTPHNWVHADQRRDEQARSGPLSEDERGELARPRVEQTQWKKDRVELEMERDDLKRSVVLWVKDAMNQ